MTYIFRDFADLRYADRRALLHCRLKADFPFAKLRLECLYVCGWHSVVVSELEDGTEVAKLSPGVDGVDEPNDSQDFVLVFAAFLGEVERDDWRVLLCGVDAHRVLQVGLVVAAEPEHAVAGEAFRVKAPLDVVQGAMAEFPDDHALAKEQEFFESSDVKLVLDFVLQGDVVVKQVAERNTYGVHGVLSDRWCEQGDFETHEES